MGGLDDQGVADSPTTPLSGVPWWWRWGDGYVPQWRLPANLPNRLAVPLCHRLHDRRVGMTGHG